MMPTRVNRERKTPVIPGYELLEDFDIADQPAHQATDAVIVEEVEGEALQVAEETTTDIGDDAGGDVGHDGDAAAIGHPFQQCGRDKTTRSTGATGSHCSPAPPGQSPAR